MVTVTSTVPVPAGAVAVMGWRSLTVKVAVAVPNFTAVAPVKLVPVMVTEVPPAAGPELGLTPVTVGPVGGLEAGGAQDDRQGGGGPGRRLGAAVGDTAAETLVS